MDGMHTCSRMKSVLVLAATNRPNAIDLSLRRFGRFDKEIDLGVPDKDGRLQILSIHTRNMKLGESVNLETLAEDLSGYVGADIAELCTEAAMTCIREKLDIIDVEADSIDTEILDSLSITHEHFLMALGKGHQPSSLRENVKQDLQEMIGFPTRHASKFEKFGLNPSRGCLFYGPPGSQSRADPPCDRGERASLSEGRKQTSRVKDESKMPRIYAINKAQQRTKLIDTLQRRHQ